MSDWYDEGSSRLIKECVADTGVQENGVLKVYAWLAQVGLIDYDIEKEVIYARYFEEN